MCLSDYSGIFKKSIVTLQRIENPFDDYYVIHLKPDPSVTWTPGEHAVFRLPKAPIRGRKFRPFSVASSPEEGIIILGIRTGNTPSAYKKHLINMKENAPIIMHGPFGGFKIKDNTSPIVIFAAGVGITPIRALLVSLSDIKTRPIEIVYASEQQFLFEEALQSIIATNPSMTMHKTQTIPQTQEQLTMLAKKYGNKAYYYFSGAPSVIKSVRSLCAQNGIARRRMINDPFYGYKR